MASGLDLQYPVNAAGRLVEPQQLGDIVLRAQPDGSLLRVRDLGRVELGAQDYKTFSRFDQKPASVVLVYLSPGANAVDTADRVRKLLDDAQVRFPEGLRYRVGLDVTRFVRTSIAPAKPLPRSTGTTSTFIPGSGAWIILPWPR